MESSTGNLLSSGKRNRDTPLAAFRTGRVANSFLQTFAEGRDMVHSPGGSMDESAARQPGSLNCSSKCLFQPATQEWRRSCQALARSARSATIGSTSLACRTGSSQPRNAPSRSNVERATNVAVSVALTGKAGSASSIPHDDERKARIVAHHAQAVTDVAHESFHYQLSAFSFTPASRRWSLG